MQVVTISNVETREYFVSTDHCQPTKELGPHWVPCTHYLPYRIVPRPGFESGIIATVEECIRFEDMYNTRIPNPDPKYAVMGF